MRNVKKGEKKKKCSTKLITNYYLKTIICSGSNTSAPIRIPQHLFISFNQAIRNNHKRNWVTYSFREEVDGHNGAYIYCRKTAIVS